VLPPTDVRRCMASVTRDAWRDAAESPQDVKWHLQEPARQACRNASGMAGVAGGERRRRRTEGSVKIQGTVAYECTTPGPGVGRGACKRRWLSCLVRIGAPLCLGGCTSLGSRCAYSQEPNVLQALSELLRIKPRGDGHQAGKQPVVS
jgi:hypothetical protein